MELLTTPPSLETLSLLPTPDLELLKSHLTTLHAQILCLQNSRAPLLRLPGEIRNQIFHLAMCGELADRHELPPSPIPTGGGDGSGSGAGAHEPATDFFSPPAFLRTCRRIREEALGVWFGEIVVWEEWVEGVRAPVRAAGATAGTPMTAVGVSATTTTTTVVSMMMKARIVMETATVPVGEENKGFWRRMSADQIRELRALRAKAGPARVVMRRVFCEEEKLKGAVEDGWSLCARRGVVRVEGMGRPCGMRWWVW